MNAVLDGIEVEEFNELMDQFIEREDPGALTFAALDEAIRKHLDKMTTAFGGVKFHTSHFIFGGGNMLEWNRITFDPNVMGGRACIRGMRITAALVLNLIANGMRVDEILTEYPYLEPEDIQQVLRYAAWLAEESVHPLEAVPV